jgi:ABC-type nitrate/sulfonate/bicarbonate transport system substrate-binding protein
MLRLLAPAIALLVFAGCGGVGGGGTTDSDVALLLGTPPAGVHAGIFLAAERDFDAAEGIDLEVRGRGNARRLLRNGRVQAALVRRDDVAASGAVCVMALVQRPQPDHFVCVTRATLDGRRSEVEALVRTLQRGYVEAAVDPESAVQAVVAARPGAGREALAAELDALAGAFEAGVRSFGELRRDALPPGDFADDLVGPVSRD